MIIEINNQYPYISHKKLIDHFGWNMSSFYRWKKRGSSHKKSSKKELILKSSRDIFERSSGTYGAPRIYNDLKDLGYSVSKNTVATYMRELGLDARRKRKYRVKTTDSSHKNSIAQRVFKVEDQSTMPNGPGEVLAADITYIILMPNHKKLYLAVVIDIFNREVVGWNLGSSLKTELILKALESAMCVISPTSTIIHHSDRGCQYTSEVYTDFLKKHRILPSMSRRGNCYDNAYVESFFSTLKKEFIYRCKITTEEDMRYGLLKYINLWYNKYRSHSSLGYVSPNEFKKAYEKRICKNSL